MQNKATITTSPDLVYPERAGSDEPKIKNKIIKFKYESFNSEKIKYALCKWNNY